MTNFLLRVSRNRIGRRVGKLKFSFGGKFEFKSYLITTVITCQFDEFFFYFLFPGIELEDESEGEVISSELQKKEQERKRHQSNKNLVKTHKRTLSGGVVRTNLRPKTWLGEASPIEVPDRKIDVVTLVEIPFKIFCTSLAWYHRCIEWKI